MQQQFIDLATSITGRCKFQLMAFASFPEQRLKALQAMTAELKQLREAWEAMTGETIELPTFNQIIKLETL